MRLILVGFILLLSTLPVIGQDVLTFTDVISEEGVSKEDLYGRAKLWFATIYNSADAVIQVDDKDAAQIIGKATFKYNPTVFSGSETTKGNIKYIIKFFAKDGRYKYEISDFTHDPTGNQNGRYSVGVITMEESCPRPKSMAKGWSDKIWNDVKVQINNNINPLVISLKNGMKKPLESNSDDW